MDNKKKITIAVVVVAIIIAIAIIVFLVNKNTNAIYTISFNTNGGEEVVSQKIENGKTVTKPSNPSKEGYEFLGWYLNGKEFDFSEPIEGDVTLEAKWKEVNNDNEDKQDEDANKEDKDEKEEVTKYTVTFDSNGGSAVTKQTVEKNNTAKQPKDPTRSGYTFQGWYLGSSKFNFSTKITKNITITAKWEKVEESKPSEPETKEYMVKFDSNGGSTVKTQIIEENKIAIKPNDPVKNGYKFLGWYLESTKFDFDTKITSNITLTAQWEKIEEQIPEVKKYTVTFNSDGGSTVAKQTVEENKTATKPSNPLKDGYTFLGWYHNGTLYNFSTKVTSDVTLVAKWEKNAVITYKIESTDSFVGQVKIFVTKDGEKIDGIVDITLSDNTVVKNVSIPKTGKVTNGYDIKAVTNVRER